MVKFGIFIPFLLMLLYTGCNNAGNSDPISGNSHAYRRGMTMITPSAQWREGLPSGNGIIGALVYGSIKQERVLFNHNELYYNGSFTKIPDMSAELPEVRSLLLEGKYPEANDLYPDRVREKGFSGNNAQFHPAFDMLLTTDCEKMFEDYSRTLDFETGEVEVKWRDGDTRFSRRLFVSIPDDLSAMSIKADKGNAVSGTATLDIHDLNDAVRRNGVPFDPGFTYETSIQDGYVEFRADGSGKGEFGGVMRVLTINGDMNSFSEQRGNRRRNVGSIRFEGADEVILLVCAYANEKGDLAIPRLKKKLAAINGSYEELFNRHAPIHSQKFNSMGVSLNMNGKRDTPNEVLLLDAYQGPASIELLERLHDYGRYLLLSSSRAGSNPANLQGIWNGDYAPPWDCCYGNNVNLEMNYWQALPGNLHEPMMAVYDFFDSRMDEFRYNAKQLYGTEGIYIPPFMTPDTGVMRDMQHHLIPWTEAAGWLASFYYDYYLFTGDKEFLKSRAVPFMKEVALFYEGFIVKDEHGKNMIFPSESPENQPADKVFTDPVTGRRRSIRVQINSTMAFAISKEVLNNLIRSCELLDIEKEGVERWKKLLADMPEYQINEDGAIREWMHPDFDDNYQHRHQSHIYPLFPGHEITEESSPELYEACRIAIEKRLTIGLSSQTGWSLAFMANVYARLGDGDMAVETLNILSRCCLGQNLFTYHNDWRRMGVTSGGSPGQTSPFQMDANFGISSVIIEMLCGSSADMLRILPALPTDWPTGEFHDMFTRAGVRTSAQWDMNKREIDFSLHAERDAVFDLKFPGEVVNIKCSQPDVLEQSQYGENYRAISLNKGEELDIQVKLR